MSDNDDEQQQANAGSKVRGLRTLSKGMRSVSNRLIDSPEKRARLKDNENDKKSSGGSTVSFKKKGGFRFKNADVSADESTSKDDDDNNDSTTLALPTTTKRARSRSGNRRTAAEVFGNNATSSDTSATTTSVGSDDKSRKKKEKKEKKPKDAAATLRLGSTIRLPGSFGKFKKNRAAASAESMSAPSSTQSSFNEGRLQEFSASFKRSEDKLQQPQESDDEDSTHSSRSLTDNGDSSAANTGTWKSAQRAFNDLDSDEEDEYTTAKSKSRGGSDIASKAVAQTEPTTMRKSEPPSIPKLEGLSTQLLRNNSELSPRSPRSSGSSPRTPKSGTNSPPRSPRISDNLRSSPSTSSTTTTTTKDIDDSGQAKRKGWKTLGLGKKESSPSEQSKDGRRGRSKSTDKLAQQTIQPRNSDSASPLLGAEGSPSNAAKKAGLRGLFNKTGSKGKTTSSPLAARTASSSGSLSKPLDRDRHDDEDTDTASSVTTTTTYQDDTYTLDNSSDDDDDEYGEGSKKAWRGSVIGFTPLGEQPVAKETIGRGIKAALTTKKKPAATNSATRLSLPADTSFEDWNRYSIEDAADSRKQEDDRAQKEREARAQEILEKERREFERVLAKKSKANTNKRSRARSPTPPNKTSETPKPQKPAAATASTKRRNSEEVVDELPGLEKIHARDEKSPLLGNKNNKRRPPVALVDAPPKKPWWKRWLCCCCCCCC